MNKEKIYKINKINKNIEDEYSNIFYSIAITGVSAISTIGSMYFNKPNVIYGLYTLLGIALTVKSIKNKNEEKKALEEIEKTLKI